MTLLKKQAFSIKLHINHVDETNLKNQNLETNSFEGKLRLVLVLILNLYLVEVFF